MRLTVIGCAGSFPGPASPASSYLVEVRDTTRTWRVLVDLGNGALGALQRHLDPLDLDAVFITHLHPDHCADILGLYVMATYHPTRALAAPIPVFGPTGADERVAMMYHGLEQAHLGDVFAFTPLSDSTSVHVGPITVTAYRVNHPIEAFGFRVTDGERVLALSGDTDTCPNLTPLFTGADLVLADAAFVDGRDSTPGIHLSGSRAARAALEAGGVGRLMLTHIPAWNDPDVCRLQAQQLWPGPVELAQAGASYDI